MSKIEEGRGFFGIIIPAEIVESSELTVGEKFVYGFIASFTKACFLSNEDISARTGVSEATVSRAINRLARMGYLFIELVNNNNAKRRIYSVFDNPKKLAYLSKKGLLNREERASFPQSNQIDESVEKSGKSFPQSNQNDETSRQNDESHNGGESNQNDDHRIRIKEEESKTPTSRAMNQPAPARPMRKNYQTNEEWEKAVYDFMATPA